MSASTDTYEIWAHGPGGLSWVCIERHDGKATIRRQDGVPQEAGYRVEHSRLLVQRNAPGDRERAEWVLRDARLTITTTPPLPLARS